VRVLGRVFRFLFWVFLISWLGRKLFGWLSGQTAPSRTRIAEVPLEARPLYRDPVCGTFVSAEVSYPSVQAGQSLHFCSAECRDRYRAARPQAAGA